MKRVGICSPPKPGHGRLRVIAGNIMAAAAPARPFPPDRSPPVSRAQSRICPKTIETAGLARIPASRQDKDIGP